MNEDENGRQFTTVHDRYHISDECCGLVETRMTHLAALSFASAHAERHAKEPDSKIRYVSVYDVMAKKNAVFEWQVPIPGVHA